MRYIATVLFVIVSFPGLALADADPDAARKSELLYLLKHDCGSCHGMTRKGGLGPALLPENMQDRPPQMLVNTVLDGRAVNPVCHVVFPAENDLYRFFGKVGDLCSLQGEIAVQTTSKAASLAGHLQVDISKVSF